MLASIDHHQNGIYIGSVTKTVAPALRIGFMIGHTPFINAAAALRELIDKQGDTVLEEGVCGAVRRMGKRNGISGKPIKIYKERQGIFFAKCCRLISQIR